MKKLVIILSILALSVGCGTKDKTKNTTAATKEDYLSRDSTIVSKNINPGIIIDTIEISENNLYLQYFGSFRKSSNPQKPTVFPEYEKKIIMEGSIIGGKKHGVWKVYNYKHGPGLISENLKLEEWKIEYNAGNVISKFFDYILRCENKMVEQVFPKLEDELSLDYPNPNMNGSIVNKRYLIPTDCGDLIYDFNNFSNLNESKFEMLDQRNKLFSCEFWSLFLSANKEPKNDFLSCINWKSKLSRIDLELSSSLNDLSSNNDLATRYKKFAFCDVNNDDIMDLLVKDSYQNRVFTKMTFESPLIEITDRIDKY